MKVKLHSITPDAEATLVEAARVSSSRENKREDYGSLIRYLIRNKHFSPFDLVNVSLEITTSKAVSIQLLRHWTLHPQELSMRYQNVGEMFDDIFEPVEIRKQSENNRQSSKEVFDPEIRTNNNPLIFYTNEEIPSYLASGLIDDLLGHIETVYRELINNGVARECARMILPMCTKTTIFFNGTLRSWLSVLNVRLDAHSQKETREVAVEIAKIIEKEFPYTAEATNRFNDYKGMFM